MLKQKLQETLTSYIRDIRLVGSTAPSEDEHPGFVGIVVRTADMEDVLDLLGKAEILPPATEDLENGFSRLHFINE